MVLSGSLPTEPLPHLHPPDLHPSTNIYLFIRLSQDPNELPEKSLFCLQKTHPVRSWAIGVVYNKWFDRVIMGLIFFNCVFLAIDSKEPDFADTIRGKMVNGSENVFLAAFCLEMCFKIVAMGFAIGRNSYLSDNWNRLDFIVVILGIVAALDLGNFSAIRTVRVLRPLRTITGFEGMRKLVETLLKSIPLLMDVLILVSFLFFVLGLVGVQMFAGKMDRRCATLENPLTGCEKCGTSDTLPITECAANCSLPLKPRWAVDDDTLCGAPRLSKYPARGPEPAGYMCEAGSYCIEQDSPNFGITNFDNILSAWLTIFQCISLEGWTDVMYWVQDAVSPYAWIYFCLMIIFGSFFAINLALAVLYVAFVSERQPEEEEDVDELKAHENDSEEAYQAARLSEVRKMLEDAEVEMHTAPSTPGQASTASGNSSTGSSPVVPLHGDIPAEHEQTRHIKPWAAEGYASIQDWAVANGGDVEDVAVINGKAVVIKPSWTKKFQRQCRHLAVSAVFANVTMGLIIVNTVIMASEFYGMPKDMVTAYEIVNYFVTVYFALEMVIKIIGLKPRGYVADSFNIFDGVVVIISIVELGASDSGGSLSVLRSFRLMRILKLARSWPQLRKIIATVLQAIPSISSLSGMLVLFIFIFDLLGMQMFGYEFVFCDSYEVEGAEPTCPLGIASSACPKRRDCYAPCAAAQKDSWMTYASGAQGPCVMYTDGATTNYLARLGRSDQPRHNFDDIYWGFVTIFQVLTGENWNEVMYDGMRTQGTGACVYFLLLVIIGNYIILNLFLAILLDNFSEIGGGEEGEEEEEEKETAASEAEIEGVAHKQDEKKDDASTEKQKKQYDAMGREIVSTNLMARAHNALKAFVKHKAFDNTIIVLILVSSALLAVDSPKVNPESTLADVLEILDLIFVVIFAIEAGLKIGALGTSYFMNSWNILDFVIVIISIVSAVISNASNGGSLSALRALRAFRALRPMRVAARSEGMKVVVSALFQAVPAIGNVALVCFLFYLIFGILGLNLFMGKMHRCVEVDGDVLSPLQLGIDEKLMTREWCKAGYHVVGCIGESKATFYSAGESGWTCVENNASTTQLDDASNAMQTWGGKWTCTASADTLAVINATDTGVHGILGSAFYGPEGAVSSALTSGKFESACEPAVLHTNWELPGVYDFDNIGSSVLILFETATLEMWLDVMYHSVDAVEEGFHPRFNYNPAACIFYIIFIVTGAFFIMNLFVGVTIDKFNEMKEAASKEKGEGATVFVTEEQQRWQQVEKMMANIKPVKHYTKPKNKFRLAFFKVCTTTRFDAAVMILILANVLVMAMTYAGESDTWANNLFITNTVFTYIFALEVIAKNIAIGPAAYFSDAWNRFDVAVVAMSIAGFVITIATTTKASYLALLRIFRIARAFRLIKRAKGLRTLLHTLIFSLPALINVGSVLFLFFFIFGVMGMNLFGRIKMQENVTRHANFNDFPNSMLVLFRMATGESWNGIMHDCMIEKGCMEVLTGTNAGNWFDPKAPELDGLTEDTDFINRCSPSKEGTVIFFIVFVLLCAFVMLNLVIAVILDNFESFNQSDSLPVSESDLSEFAHEWGRLDMFSTYYIKVSQLPKLLKAVNAPLGFKSIPDDIQGKALNKFLLSCDIKLQGHGDGARIHFVDTLQALASRVDGFDKPEETNDVAKEDIDIPTQDGLLDLDRVCVKHYHGAVLVQCAWKVKLARKTYELKREASRRKKLQVGSA